MKKGKLLKGFMLAMIPVCGLLMYHSNSLKASSHREAPLIANDPVADNTDLYAFRSPDDTNTVTLIANYIPGELPQGGPNYYSFAEGVRYEIHVKNNMATEGDNIIYRFEFSQINQDPTTFFNIRLGQENLKTTYTCSKSTNGGRTFRTIVSNGIVPPNNIGPRSISSPVGLNASSYDQLRTNAIATAVTSEKIFCGPSDDPFFVDLGGIFDLGQTRAGNGARDGLACKNIHSICIKAPISSLQKDGKTVAQAANILDSQYIIGVYATASRQKMTVRADNGTKPVNSGKWIQISRLGMPLTNEVVMPIGRKDYWNSLSPYSEDTALEKYFTNPELALYMDNSQFGGAVPAFSALRIQSSSLQSFDFRNYHNGLSGLLGNPATAGTAFDQALFGNYLLRPGQPRSVDLLPIFLTGVPNLPPYQLATGKNGNPLAAGKPFINNFLPTFGDMLRLNMAVPVTQRNDPAFSSLGLVAAAVSGLTDPAYNGSTSLQFIPNMDGFPNGRRLEDDVTRIELQAVSGVVLAAVGLWYDDYIVGSQNPVTPNLVGVLSYTTGVESNDVPFVHEFPYLAPPPSGFGDCGGSLVQNPSTFRISGSMLGISTPDVFLMQNFPNPATTSTTFRFRVQEKEPVTLVISDVKGRVITTILSNQLFSTGTHDQEVNISDLSSGIYFATLSIHNRDVQTIRFMKE